MRPNRLRTLETAIQRMTAAISQGFTHLYYDVKTKHRYMTKVDPAQQPLYTRVRYADDLKLFDNKEMQELKFSTDSRDYQQYLQGMVSKGRPTIQLKTILKRSKEEKQKMIDAVTERVPPCLIHIIEDGRRRKLTQANQLDFYEIIHNLFCEMEEC